MGDSAVRVLEFPVQCASPLVGGTLKSLLTQNNAKDWWAGTTVGSDSYTELASTTVGATRRRSGASGRLTGTSTMLNA